MRKGDWYKHLFGRIDQAIADNYYYEASFICYGIIEDRLNSLMNLYGLTIGGKGVAQKIKTLAKVRSSNSEKYLGFDDWDGGKYRDKGLLKDCLLWGELYRNPMQHALGDPRNYKATVGNFHTDNTKDLAEEGKKVARELSSTIMRFKKKTR